MIAEVINTGSELLLGQVVNTHLAFLGEKLFGHGIRIERQLAIPDGEAIRHALEEAFARRPDVIFVTGGLGPTTDDITRDLLAEMLGAELVQNDEILEMIEARFARRGATMTSRIGLQALVPVGVHPILNDWGTAPGLHLPASERNPHTFFLPGPPRELKPMFNERVAPLLRELFPNQANTVCRVHRIVGMGESDVENQVGRQLLALEGLELGYCARSAEVDVRLVGAPEVVAIASEIVETALSDATYAYDDGTMEQTVVELLRSRKQTLATAESCTGGLLSHRLTNVPGASEVFGAGYVTYANEAKASTLGVDPQLISEHGAVSEPVARAMVDGARQASGSDFALSTTGIAGPGGGTEAKPVGTVFIALASPDGTEVFKYFFPTDRETFKFRATQTALNHLREKLKKL
ncbi:MAG TPA: competence/damage-inducible protein A [Chthoniobacterales bacterium]|jgi:nicotinamide-nucleotide amidase